jgi:hypothetical protein
MEAAGVDQLVLNTISKCDIDLRRDLYNNIGNIFFKISFKWRFYNV